MAERNTDASENTFDSALIDPRLLQLDAASEASRSSTQAPASTHSPAPALSPAPLQLPASVPALPQDQFQNANGDPMQGHDSELPSTVYMSLDRLLTTRNVTANEHLWYMGIQYGIGLGIMSTREAILNEMQHHHTVFNRTFQLDEHDFNYFHMRMTIGQACTVGFDLRVAQRAANAVIDQQRLIAQTVVTDGLTSALPGIGDPVIGTSTFFSEEDVARCHDNSRLLDETFLQGNAQELPGLEMGGGSDIGAERFTASFLAGGPNIGGIDMTRLDGTAGLVANAITMSTNGNTGIANAIPMSTNDRTGIANALPMSTNGSPGLPIGHDLGKGFPPIAASMLHLNQLSPFGGGVAPTMLHLNRPPFWGGAIPPAGTSMPHHRRIHQSASHSRNNARGGDETEYENMEDFEEAFKISPKAKLRAKSAPRKTGAIARRSTRGRSIRRISRNVQEGSSSMNTMASRKENIATRPTRGGRARTTSCNIRGSSSSMNTMPRGGRGMSTSRNVRGASLPMNTMTRGGTGMSASRNVQDPASSALTTTSGEDSLSSDDEQPQLRPSLTETESGRAVIQTARKPKRSNETS